MWEEVLLETPSRSNAILCSSYDWWIMNSYSIQIPEQIIIPYSIRVCQNLYHNSFSKKLSQDWFRDPFYLASIKLERSISPLRRNSGKLIILMEEQQKKLGKITFVNIQPSKQINYMLPFD